MNLMERVDELEERVAAVEGIVGLVRPAPAVAKAAEVEVAAPATSKPARRGKAVAEPGSVLGCCPDNIAHQIVRLIPQPGAASNVIGDGMIQVKSLATGEYVSVYCCPFCNKRGK